MRTYFLPAIAGAFAAVWGCGGASAATVSPVLSCGAPTTTSAAGASSNSLTTTIEGNDVTHLYTEGSRITVTLAAVSKAADIIHWSIADYAGITYERIEHEYAHAPDWFAKAAYIRADFDKPGIQWKMLGGDYTDHFDLFGDGVVTTIFTPGHSPGHQSFLVRLPNTGPVLLTVDAAYTLDHWNNKALPGLVCSAPDSAASC